jgi:hypothetical protein
MLQENLYYSAKSDPSRIDWMLVLVMHSYRERETGPGILASVDKVRAKRVNQRIYHKVSA